MSNFWLLNPFFMAEICVAHPVLFLPFFTFLVIILLGLAIYENILENSVKEEK